MYTRVNKLVPVWCYLSLEQQQIEDNGKVVHSQRDRQTGVYEQVR